MADRSRYSAVFVATLAAAWLAAGCDHRKPESQIAFDAARVDIGEVDAGASKEVRFPFRNTGSKPLTITKVDVSCGCLSPQFPQEVPPGGGGEIKVRFEPQAFWSGKVTKELTVYSSDPRHRAVPLQMDATIVPYVRIEPPGPLEVEYQRGATVERDLRLIPRSGALHIVSIDPGTPLLRTEIEQRIPDREYWITLRKAREWRPGDVRANVQIRTDDPAFPEITVPFDALVLQPPK